MRELIEQGASAEAVLFLAALLVRAIAAAAVAIVSAREAWRSERAARVELERLRRAAARPRPFRPTRRLNNN